MSTPFPAWLDTLGRQRADMPMTVRGQAISHTVTYPGDVTTATLAGAVKASPDATSELAVFTVGTPVFADGVTTWTISMAGSVTGGLPADADGDGRIDLIYDFLLTLSGGTAQRIFGGLFPVSGFVTESTMTPLPGPGSGGDKVGPFPDGTVSVPAIRFANSPSTGIFRPADNVFAVSTGGVEQLRIDTSGSVGIGTSSPFVNVLFTGLTVGGTKRGLVAVKSAAGVDAGYVFAGDNNSVNLESAGSGPVAINTVNAQPVIVTTNNLERLRVTQAGIVRPGSDNTQDFGEASLRWSTIFAGTGTINTSDEREKVWRGPLNEAELRAAKRIAAEIGIFQFISAIDEKGPDARFHCGVKAQQVFGILEDEGLDWRRYAWCCFDEWEDDGDLVAGNRYGIRADQLAFWLIAAQEQRLLALET